MKYNIIFLLKLRKHFFDYYKENKFYKFNPSQIRICDAEVTFDKESMLVFEFLSRYAHPNKVFYLKNICQFSFNILVATYKTQEEALQILDFNKQKCEEYINKNIMSCVLIACKYKNMYFIFSTFLKSNCVKFDKNNDTHLELANYYYKEFIDYKKLFFSDDVVKYIKINGKYKLTKFYPFLINL